MLVIRIYGKKYIDSYFIISDDNRIFCYNDELDFFEHPHFKTLEDLHKHLIKTINEGLSIQNFDHQADHYREVIKNYDKIMKEGKK